MDANLENDMDKYLPLIFFTYIPVIITYMVICADYPKGTNSTKILIFKIWLGFFLTFVFFLGGVHMLRWILEKNVM